MKITVCVKQVPNTGTDRELRQDDSTVAREAADAVINELDEFAIEEGLRLAGYGVVGDLFDVVPQLTEEIKRRGQEG
jgi:electron transfer flavoprotein alpha/beta subunit